MSALVELLGQPGASFETEDDAEAASAYCYERGWTDGLPVIAPSVERVQRMLAYCDRPPEQPVAKLAPRYGEATPLRVAANAVMAGCLPEYFPLVLTALEAMAEEPYNLYGTQATTHSCAPLIIVNGPIARELGINCGHSALGSGTRANATIGRAVRLSLVNIGGAIPAIGDMATYGTPTKYTYCAAENEAASPWEPLHVERGFPATASTVTVLACEGPHNINDHESKTAEGILKTIAGTIATVGQNNAYHDSDPVVLFGPEHAATVAAEGLSKQDVKRYLYDHARIALGKFSHENIERRMRIKFPERYAKAGPEAQVPMVQRPENYNIVVIGGAGKHSAYIPTFGGTRSVTRALKLSGGGLAASIGEFKRPG
jgi:hypothetical protein